jgi:glycosyltransferase involved in cell wall biosynthesis
VLAAQARARKPKSGYRLRKTSAPPNCIRHTRELRPCASALSTTVSARTRSAEPNAGIATWPSDSQRPGMTARTRHCGSGSEGASRTSPVSRRLPSARACRSILAAGADSRLSSAPRGGSASPAALGDDVLDGLYRAATCFVFPPWPRALAYLLDALVRGTPVACSNASSLPDVAGDEVLYFEPTDTEAISAAIERLLEDSALRNRLRASGPEQAPKSAGGERPRERSRAMNACSLLRARRPRTSPSRPVPK